MTTFSKKYPSSYKKVYLFLIKISKLRPGIVFYLFFLDSFGYKEELYIYMSHKSDGIVFRNGNISRRSLNFNEKFLF